MIERLRSWDRARGGLAVDFGLYAVSAGFALVTALSSTLAPHRVWGGVAVCGYAAATVLVLVQLLARRGGRAAVAALAWAAVALLPLVILAVRDQGQEEVFVVERAGQRLLETGTPYLGRGAIAALPDSERLLGYAPYQPGMALFGLPRAIAGNAWWADPRVWFALVTIAALATASVLLKDRANGAALVRAGQAATVLPFCALTLATGGDDLPVLALCLLAFAFAARGRMLGTGVTVGAAAALKLFAWPVAIVLLVYAATRGRRSLVRFAVPAAGLPIVTLLPALAVDPDAATENLVRFPLGHGLVSSPAASNLPGHLIAVLLPGGRVIAVALLAAAGAAIGWWLLRRPPRDAAAAAAASGYGLAAAILLMPSTRFGYLLYPIAFLVSTLALTAVSAARTPATATTASPS
jgi:hypothetical protein